MKSNWEKRREGENKKIQEKKGERRKWRCFYAMISAKKEEQEVLELDRCGEQKRRPKEGERSFITLTQRGKELRRWWRWRVGSGGGEEKVMEVKRSWWRSYRGSAGPAGTWGRGQDRSESQKGCNWVYQASTSSIHPFIPNKAPGLLPSPPTPHTSSPLPCFSPYRAGPEGSSQSDCLQLLWTFSHHSLHSSERERGEHSCSGNTQITQWNYSDYVIRVFRLHRKSTQI